MYYLCIVVRTDESHPEHATIDQAYVDCWVERDTEAEAVEAATNLITAEPWIIERVEGAEIVTAANYVDDPEARQYYEQAVKDKEVLMFHTAPRCSTYFLQYDVKRDTPDERGLTSAEATIWISNDCVIENEPKPDQIDVFDPEFWSKRADTVQEIAKGILAEEGWEIAGVIQHFPFENRAVEQQPDLAEFVDNAEDNGMSLVIWDGKDDADPS